MSNHTPGPWKRGDWDENGGYDCMTSGLTAGPADLDGYRYGQERCVVIAAVARRRMEADADLIAAAPDLYEALEGLLYDFDLQMKNPSHHMPFNYPKAKAALAKARGEKQT